MPTIGNPSPIPTTVPASATTATTTTPATPATTPPVGTQPPVPTAGPQVNARKVTTFGLGAAQMTLSNTTNRFKRDASFDTYNETGEGPVDRGFLTVEATPIPGGCRIKLNTFHQRDCEELNIFLLAEVLDKKTNQLRTITLAVLAQEVILNPSTYRGKCFFDLDYAEVNKYLQARNPSLQLNPGTTELAVAAQWTLDRHQAGGFGRGGNFRLPLPQGQTQNVVSIRTNAAVGTHNADLPLDMQVAYPANLVAAMPKLKQGGNVVSRLESELKGSSSKQEMLAAIKEAYRLASLAHSGRDRDVEAVLGKDWTIEPVSRYWLKDDGSANQPGSAGTGMFKGFRVDADGFPMQDPMTDRYMDDAQLGMTRLEGAIRLRSNKQATGINVKPGGGRRDDKTQITQRIEVGLELVPEATSADAATVLRELAGGEWSGTVFNQAQKAVKALDPNLQLANALVPWIDITQERHKFTVKNKVTGVEVELSLDKVHTKTLRPEHNLPNGQPREEDFYVLEAELDHLQLQSTNQGTYVAGPSVSQGAFSTDQQQDGWLTTTSQDVTMDIEPRLHELSDLDNESFRQTISYKAFEGLSKKLLPALFPSGLGTGRQKAAYAAELMGLVNFDPAKLKGSLERMTRDEGFVWTPQLDQAATAAFADPVKRKALDLAVAQGRVALINAVNTQLGAGLLGYDMPILKARFVAKLESLGYDTTPAIDQMLDKITVANLPPQKLDAYLTQLAEFDDVNVLSMIARLTGTRHVPAPVKAPQKYFTAATEQALATQLDAQGIEPGQAKEIVAFFRDIVTAGHSLQQARAVINAFSFGCVSTIDQLAAGFPTVKKPELRASEKGLCALADRYMKAQFVALDADARAVLKKVAETRPFKQALQFAQGLSINAGAILEREAKALGLSYKADYDWAAFDQAMTPYTTQASVVVDAALTKFLRDCFAGGVPANVLQQAVARTVSMDLPTALRSSNVFIVGPQIPSVQYDTTKVAALATQRLSTYAAGFKKSWVDAVSAHLLKGGASPQQIQDFFAYLPSHGVQRAGTNVQVAHLASSLPAVEIDEAGMAAYYAQRCGAQWTPAHAQYAATALAAIAQKPPASVAALFQGSYAQQVVQQLRALSGVAPPAGI